MKYAMMQVYHGVMLMRMKMRKQGGLIKVKIGLVDYLGVEMMMRKKLQRIQKQKKFRK